MNYIHRNSFEVETRLYEVYSDKISLLSDWSFNTLLVWYDISWIKWFGSKFIKLSDWEEAEK